jgi:hypothetical protein
MALEELKDNITEVDHNVRSYLKNTEEYYKLKGFKIAMRSITSFVKILMIGSLALLSLFMLSFAFAHGIGQWLDNVFLGFLIMGGFYILIGIVAYLFRNKVDGRILKKFSEYFFD